MILLKTYLRFFRVYMYCQTPHTRFVFASHSFKTLYIVLKLEYINSSTSQYTATRSFQNYVSRVLVLVIVCVKSKENITSRTTQKHRWFYFRSWACFSAAVIPCVKKSCAIRDNVSRVCFQLVNISKSGGVSWSQ